jgi:DNA (cytosine-5)-methyltransferase 1
VKILNLYAGIGGNRKLWGNEHEITAVELDEDIAAIYKDFYPTDKVIVGDAHKYLLDNYKEFDFIWSSPPCPTHSRINFNFQKNLKYPAMELYQEIIFLRQWFKGKYCVENVIPYYPPLIPAKEYDRHLFWTNFLIGTSKYTNVQHILRGDLQTKAKIKEVELDDLKKVNKSKVINNMVNSKTGQYILDCATNVIRKEKTEQTKLF